jgi:hypothetical protein
MNPPDGGTIFMSLSHIGQNRNAAKQTVRLGNRKSSCNIYDCLSFLFRNRSDARVALQQSPVLQNDMDKIIEMNYNGKRESKSLRPFTQLNEQTHKY